MGRVETRANMPKMRVHNGSANFQDGLKWMRIEETSTWGEKIEYWSNYIAMIAYPYALEEVGKDMKESSSYVDLSSFSSSMAVTMVVMVTSKVLMASTTCVKEMSWCVHQSTMQPLLHPPLLFYHLRLQFYQLPHLHHLFSSSSQTFPSQYLPLHLWWFLKKVQWFCFLWLHQGGLSFLSPLGRRQMGSPPWRVKKRNILKKTPHVATGSSYSTHFNFLWWYISIWSNR